MPVTQGKYIRTGIWGPLIHSGSAVRIDSHLTHRAVVPETSLAVCVD
jgi:hypothetical protein